jgi:hypothetical protein
LRHPNTSGRRKWSSATDTPSEPAQVVRLSELRSDTYQRFYRYLRDTGGIFFHRWGDAPIRHLGLHLQSGAKTNVEVTGCSHP